MTYYQYKAILFIREGRLTMILEDFQLVRLWLVFFHSIYKPMNRYEDM